MLELCQVNSMSFSGTETSLDFNFYVEKQRVWLLQRLWCVWDEGALQDHQWRSQGGGRALS